MNTLTPDIVDRGYSLSPIGAAITAQNLDAIDLLMKLGADINAPCYNNHEDIKSPLQLLITFLSEDDRPHVKKAIDILSQTKQPIDPEMMRKVLKDIFEYSSFRDKSPVALHLIKKFKDKFNFSKFFLDSIWWVNGFMPLGPRSIDPNIAYARFPLMLNAGVDVNYADENQNLIHHILQLPYVEGNKQLNPGFHEYIVELLLNHPEMNLLALNKDGKSIFEYDLHPNLQPLIDAAKRVRMMEIVKNERKGTGTFLQMFQRILLIR